MTVRRFETLLRAEKLQAQLENRDLDVADVMAAYYQAHMPAELVEAVLPEQDNP